MKDYTGSPPQRYVLLNSVDTDIPVRKRIASNKKRGCLERIGLELPKSKFWTVVLFAGTLAMAYMTAGIAFNKYQEIRSRQQNMENPEINIERVLETGPEPR